MSALLRASSTPPIDSAPQVSALATALSRGRRSPRLVAGGLVVACALAIGVFTCHRFGSASDADPSDTSATVVRGTLTVRLVEAGVLKPARSITYRSPLGGRETEVLFLAPEGFRIQAGDLVAQLDASELDAELAAARQTLRQAQIEQQAADADRMDAEAGVESLTSGAGLVEVEEGRSRLSLADRNVQRLRQEYENLKPLLQKGFVTSDELDRLSQELEQAQADATIQRRKVGVLVEKTRPREQQKMNAAVSQRSAQVELARARVSGAETQIAALTAAIDACRIFAKRPGLVVYEDYMAASPRRRIRVGDRVTPTQGLVTIPEVGEMIVESSLRESDLHKVRPGLPAEIRVDAFPDVQLSGRLLTIGALARASQERAFEEKRFDVVVATDSADEKLRPDMTARVALIVAERRNVLLVPANAVFERDGVAAIAHTITAWGVKTVPVKLGLSNGLYVEVVSGLIEGTRVSLVDRRGSSTSDQSRRRPPS